MDCNELVLFISTLAISISEGKSSDEINTLAVAFTQLGDTLATIADCKDRNKSPSSEK